LEVADVAEEEGIDSGALLIGAVVSVIVTIAIVLGSVALYRTFDAGEAAALDAQITPYGSTVQEYKAEQTRALTEYRLKPGSPNEVLLPIDKAAEKFVRERKERDKAPAAPAAQPKPAMP
jgi:hypothetical protein